MKINVRKLDATIAKLQELRRLATDPALSNFVDIDGAKSNSNGSANHAEGGESNGRGTLKPNVLAACRTFPGNFTIKDVFDVLQKQGHEFNGDNALKSVANVLRQLVLANSISVAVPGKGRNATQYRC